MRDNTIKCDGCGRDITTTGNIVDYRLHLSVVQMPVRGTMATLLHIIPPLDGDKDFCGLSCLAHWAQGAIVAGWTQDVAEVAVKEVFGFNSGI